MSEFVFLAEKMMFLNANIARWAAVLISFTKDSGVNKNQPESLTGEENSQILFFVHRGSHILSDIISVTLKSLQLDFLVKNLLFMLKMSALYLRSSLPLLFCLLLLC